MFKKALSLAAYVSLGTLAGIAVLAVVVMIVVSIHLVGDAFGETGVTVLVFGGLGALAGLYAWFSR